MTLAARFAEPNGYRPVPIWWWSGAPLCPDRLRWQMQRMIEGGIRQAVVLNLAPSGPLYGALADEPEFFTEPWWDIFTRVCKDAEALGFGLWFYDQLGFSGADLQGRLLREHREYGGRRLDRVPADAVPAGATVLATKEGTSVVSLPHGFDYLSVAACEALRDRVHGEFERRVGGLFGSVIVGSFQDELPSMPTWCDSFGDEFRRRRGYPIEEVLHWLWEDNPDAGRARVDYQRTRAELAEEAFFRPLFEWHDARGLLVGCDQQHPARAGYPIEGVQQYADYLRTHRWFSAPGSDHWGEAKVHSSLAHSYGRPRTWIEAFHSTGWGGTLEETLDWLLPWLRAGANLFNPHAVYYATPRGNWEWAPPSTCWRQPYWPDYGLLSDTVARLCAALTWGVHSCEVAVLFPTAAAQRVAALGLAEHLHGTPAGVSPAQDLYLDVVGRMHWFDPQPGVLDRSGWDFDVLDDDTVLQATVEAGRLCVGDESYRALVLPGCGPLDDQLRTVLQSWVDQGGRVVEVGSGPGLRGSLRCSVAEQAPALLADLPRTVIADRPTLLRTDGSSHLLFLTAGQATRQPAGARWREEGIDVDVRRYDRATTVTVPGAQQPVVLWDPVSGSCHELDSVLTARGLQVEVPFASFPGALVVWGEEALTGPAGSGFVRPGRQVEELTEWTARPVPSPSDPYGDSGLPARPGVTHHWHLEHERDGRWTPIRAGYEPRARACIGGHSWDVSWSDDLGADGTGDPKGFVPEEFLDLGEVAAGTSATLTLRLRVAAGRQHLVVGSTARVTAILAGAPVSLDQPRYYARGVVDSAGGVSELELGLTARCDGPLRLSISLASAPVDTCPEWLTGQAVLTGPGSEGGLVQLGTLGRVSLLADGLEIARHGETDNYTHRAQPRVRRYQLPRCDQVQLLLHDATSAAVMDGAAVTDDRWDAPPILVAPPHDPRWVLLRPRPHPLSSPLVTVREGPARERFRFQLPPGAAAVRLPEAATATVADRQVRRTAGEHRFEPVPAGTWCQVDLPGRADRRGGGLWDGPATVTRCEFGAMPLGDWQQLGLADFSGAVRYRTIARSAADVLDLGRVRGTAQVTVDGTDRGTRAWAPYTFEVAGLRSGSVIEVLVRNTLASQQAAVSTTPWVLPGQKESGLFGPVTLSQRGAPWT